MHEDTLEILLESEAYGPDHPLTKMQLRNQAAQRHVCARKACELALKQDCNDMFEEALKNYQRALELWTAALGIDHSNCAYVLSNMGAVCDKQAAIDGLDKLEEAVEYFERSLKVRPERPERICVGGGHGQGR